MGEVGVMSGMSEVSGATDIALMDTTIGEALAEAARRWPERLALISAHEGRQLTWRQLDQEATRLAAGLCGLGLSPGDRVGIWAPNGLEWALVQFATARIGVIQVNINPAYRLSEVAYTLRKVGVKALICADRFKTSDYTEMMETLAPEIPSSTPGALRCDAFPDLSAVVRLGSQSRPGWLSLADVQAREGPETRRLAAAFAAAARPGDAINIQFTSGTTGLPKGATLSHRNILNNAFFTGLGMGLGPEDRLCIPVPLYHCFGMVMGNLACVCHGSAMVYPAESFDPLRTLRAIEDHRCTGLHGVPTMFIALLEHPDCDTFDLTTLRTGLMAGSPCPIEVMRKVVERMHMRDVGIAYGMTETSPVSFQSSPDDPLDRRVSTVGRVQPHLEVKIVSPDGATTRRGEAGELCTRGYSVMLGYWGDEEKTAEAVDPDGWMHTGDLAVIDEAGYCNIVGRIKDMVIRGGENIYPREIEEFLFSMPEIEDVQVVGVPDPRFGEELCAWVKLRAGRNLTDEDVRVFCRGRIAHYKIPRYVKFVDVFPMTVTGKIQKFEIRRAMMAELGLEETRTA
jgi:fatty-acyl-CoA synthase